MNSVSVARLQFAICAAAVRLALPEAHERVAAHEVDPAHGLQDHLISQRTLWFGANARPFVAQRSHVDFGAGSVQRFHDPGADRGGAADAIGATSNAPSARRK